MSTILPHMVIGVASVRI